MLQTGIAGMLVICIWTFSIAETYEHCHCDGEIRCLDHLCPYRLVHRLWHVSVEAFFLVLDARCVSFHILLPVSSL